MALPQNQRAPHLTTNTHDPLIDLRVVDEAGGDHLLGERYLKPNLAEAVTTDAVVSQMKGAHDSLRNGFTAMKAALRSQDPTMTPEANFMDLKKRADGWLDSIAKLATDASTQAKRTIEGIDNDIRAKLEIEDGPRSNEIRRHLLGLKENDRLTVALKAIDAGDKETMAAVLIGPSFLSGFSDDQRTMLRNRQGEKMAGDLIARKKVLEECISTNLRTVDEALSAVDAIFPRHRVEEITKRRQATKAVRDGFHPL
ncbi:hypothetical protein GCM10007881_28050 [Mesorhizobium huakuii]|uniref:hypothetical protein n=1 Tax=Mesorhizobium huakuii TaxID=28104 RepID=UPI00235C772E|nr:hypothetical protein [Mesorhizobium huakuii]GLQ79287.1 hypothetical protein GCM10007881_28050 [Mesorhizobium huakuii]